MLSNTTARPVCRMSDGLAAEGLMMAPAGARLPRSTEGILGLDRPLKGADHPRIRGTAVRDALLHRPAGDS